MPECLHPDHWQKSACAECGARSDQPSLPLTRFVLEVYDPLMDDWFPATWPRSVQRPTRTHFAPNLCVFTERSDAELWLQRSARVSKGVRMIETTETDQELAERKARG